jgi:hypothetical protein
MFNDFPLDFKILFGLTEPCFAVFPTAFYSIKYEPPTNSMQNAVKLTFL